MLIRNLSFIAFIIGTAAIGTAAAGQQASAPPPGPGLDLINERCAFCHTTSQVLSVRKSPEDWAATVQVMIDRGADLNAEEEKAMLDYLTANFSTQEGQQRGHP